MRPLLISIAVVLLVGCAHTKPEEMTAEQHRLEAQRQEAEAAKDQARFDSSATVNRSSRPETEGYDPALYSYNPTAEFLGAAQAHLREAHAHYEAAKSLEQFEDAACKGLSAAERSACPLFTSYVAQVQETASGVTLNLKANSPGPQLVTQMQCHLQYAKARGFEKQLCPLYIKGVAITLSKDGAIVVTGDSSKVAATVREQARTLFGARVAAPAK